MRETKRMNSINYVTAGQSERRRRREGWTSNSGEDERIWHSEWIFGVSRQTEPSGKQFEILNPATQILSVRLFYLQSLFSVLLSSFIIPSSRCWILSPDSVFTSLPPSKCTPGDSKWKTKQNIPFVPLGGSSPF